MSETGFYGKYVAALPGFWFSVPRMKNGCNDSSRLT
jgi:hypothetical protein